MKKLPWKIKKGEANLNIKIGRDSGVYINAVVTANYKDSCYDWTVYFSDYKTIYSIDYTKVYRSFDAAINAANKVIYSHLKSIKASTNKYV